MPDITRVIVPVGGGGLVLGVASGFKATRRTGVEVVGVQAEGYPLWVRTFAEGRPPQITPETMADGTGAPYVAEMEPRLNAAVDRWIAIPESAIQQAVRDLAVRNKVVAEGSAALAYAAASLDVNGPTVAVISGGNIDPEMLSQILLRTQEPE